MQLNRYTSIFLYQQVHFNLVVRLFSTQQWELYELDSFSYTLFLPIYNQIPGTSPEPENIQTTDIATEQVFQNFTFIYT